VIGLLCSTKRFELQRECARSGWLQKELHLWLCTGKPASLFIIIVIKGASIAILSTGGRNSQQDSLL